MFIMLRRLFYCHSVVHHLIYYFTDINECEDPGGSILCDENAECNDTDGSYECVCRTGYSGDGFNCSG